jgi:hypothetical protein
MAETRPLDLDLSPPDLNTLPAYRRLGLLNGLLIGLAVGLGAWAVEALRVSRLPVPLYLPTLFLGLVTVTLLGGLTGWITARLARPFVTVVMWVLMAVMSMYVIGYLPFQGRTLVVWLADPRFWGKPVFPYTLGGTNTGLLLGGLLLILVLGVLGILQGYRLENLVVETGRRRTLSGRAWLALVFPLPFVFLASLITQSVMANPAATAVELTHQGISGTQGFEGDFLELGTAGGVNFAALRGLEGKLNGDFTLGIGEVNTMTSTVIVTADFENGNRVNCRVINDQLVYCYDAEPAYNLTLHSLMTGEALPETCRDCDREASGEWGSWFAERHERLGENPRVERLAKWGSHTLIQVTGESGFAVQCWFEGISPVQLTGCHEPER